MPPRSSRYGRSSRACCFSFSDIACCGWRADSHAPEIGSVPDRRDGDPIPSLGPERDARQEVITEGRAYGPPASTGQTDRSEIGGAGEAGRKSAVSPAGTTCRLTSVACRPARNVTSARAGPCAVLAPAADRPGPRSAKYHESRQDARSRRAADGAVA